MNLARTFLIGTLHTIENEYEECVASLRRQTCQDFEHFVVRDLPKKEAHDRLYQTFMYQSRDYELFLKLDADMVLEDEDLLAGIRAQFVMNPQLDLLTVLVDDFFTGRRMNGMHTFRNTVRWRPRQECIYTDVHSVPRNRQQVDRTKFIHSVSHCKNPSAFQSFHFGMHRGVKAREAFRVRRRWRALVELAARLDDLEAIWQNAKVCRDHRIALASVGGELALSGMLCAEHIAYTNPFANSLYENQYAALSFMELIPLAGELRRRNRIRMPWLEPIRLAGRLMLAVRLLRTREGE